VESKLGPLGTLVSSGWLWGWRILWNEDWQGKPNYSGIPAPAPLCPPQIPLDQTQARTEATAVGSQRLTTWAMAQPFRELLITATHSMTPCGLINMYWCLRGNCCFHIQERRKFPMEQWYLFIMLHNVIFQRTIIWIFTAIRISNSVYLDYLTHITHVSIVSQEVDLMTHKRSEGKGETNMVGIPFTVTWQFTLQKDRHKTDLLHLSAHHLTKWTCPYLWLWPKEWNFFPACTNTCGVSSSVTV
jgi:hypothetical protein